MKPSDIKPGKFYHDTKAGVREVLAIEGAPLRVKYKVLAAKQTQEYDYESRAMKSIIGSAAIVTLEAFAAWAKSEHDENSVADLLLNLEARKVKLSPGEQAFVRAAVAETEGKISSGMRIEIEHMEGRAVAGLVKKGLVIRDGGEAEFTKLGAAFAVAEARVL
ncbi:hypothetical protein ACI2UK_27015 [Ralstonia nicotianae]|uniref:hypothetical protein n=1 Tax=Ralstonia pseudosolanacearum TaxID=1310165 RepID=UPI002004A4D0|nr:hypothetical protein [Ralstonia pseudosolanacearum]MCK4120400.1 hypothetical protein [Ralstonia pseudosolanacearum]